MFNNSAWTKGNTTVTANQTTAPDGTATADLLVESAVNQDHYCYPTAISMVTGTTYTLSMYLKKGTGATAPDIMQLTGGATAFGSSQYANFNLNTGVVTASSGCTATITAAPNGFYRCSITLAAIATGSNIPFAVFFCNNNPLMTRAGDAGNYYLGVITSDTFTWGAQVEAGTYAKEYFPTQSKQYLMDYSTARKNLLIPNQANACEDGTTNGFSSTSSTISAEPTGTTPPWQGSYSLKVITTAGAVDRGAITNLSYLCSITPSTQYTFSVYLKGSGTVRLFFSEYTDADSWISDTAGSPITLTGDWVRYSLTRTVGSTARKFILRVLNTASDSITFYVDGMQIETGSAATTWEAPPNIGILGGAVSVTTNDPYFNHQGAVFVTDDHIQLPNSDGINNCSNITIICVFNPSALSEDYIISKYAGDSTSTGYNLLVAATKIYFRGADTSGSIQLMLDHGMSTGNYYCFTARRSDTRHELYKGSSYLGGMDVVSGLQLNSFAPVVGRRYGSSVYWLDATIAYLAIYNRALTQAEIGKNYTWLKSYLLRTRGVTLP